MTTHELHVTCTRLSKSKWSVCVRWSGDQGYTDTLDVRSQSARERFVEQMSNRWPGIDRDLILERLEQFAVVEARDDSAAADGADDSDGRSQQSANQATALVELAVERYRLGRTPADEPFAVRKDGPQIARLFRASGSALRAELSRAFYERYGVAANGSALTDAMVVLAGMAQDLPPERVHVRVARHEGDLVLDLGHPEGRCAVINAGGWRIDESSPVLFRRTELSGALPEPDPRGNIAALRPLINVDDAMWPLAVAVNVAALIPDIPHPVVMLGGGQGSGKSTGAKMLIGAVDPSVAALRGPPSDLEQWVTSAAASWIVGIDNVSRIPEWWSDALCRASTGDASTRRRLYSNDELSVFSFKRVVVLTSIDVGALRSDLGDRVVLIDLLPIVEGAYEYESDLWRRYTAAWPAIVGGVLNLTVEVLRRLPHVKLQSKSRMADFLRVLAAVDEVLGTDGVATYLGQRRRIAEEIIDGDPLGLAVLSFMDRRERWSGTAKALLLALKTPKGVAQGSDWPRTPRGMGAALRRLAPALRLVGVEVVPPDEHHRASDRSRARNYELLRSPRKDQPTVRTVRTVQSGPEGADEADEPRTDPDDVRSVERHDRPQCAAAPSPHDHVSDDADGSDGCAANPPEDGGEAQQ